MAMSAQVTTGVCRCGMVSRTGIKLASQVGSAVPQRRADVKGRPPLPVHWTAEEPCGGSTQLGRPRLDLPWEKALELGQILRREQLLQIDHGVDPSHWVLLMLGDRIELWGRRAKRVLPAMAALALIRYIVRR